MQLQIFENTFREIRDQEVKFTEHYTLPLIDLEKRLKSPTTDLANPEESVQITDMFRALNHVRHLRTFSFFNTVEYLAFLINKGFVSDTRLESFFGPAFVFWYEELLRKHDEVAEKDSKKYEEFKKLYRRLKGKIQVQSYSAPGGITLWLFALRCNSRALFPWRQGPIR